MNLPSLIKVILLIKLIVINIYAINAQINTNIKQIVIVIWLFKFDF